MEQPGLGGLVSAMRKLPEEQCAHVQCTAVLRCTLVLPSLYPLHKPWRDLQRSLFHPRVQSFFVSHECEVLVLPANGELLYCSCRQSACIACEAPVLPMNAVLPYGP